MSVPLFNVRAPRGVRVWNDLLPFSGSELSGSHAKHGLTTSNSARLDWQKTGSRGNFCKNCDDGTVCEKGRNAACGKASEAVAPRADGDHNQERTRLPTQGSFCRDDKT